MEGRRACSAPAAAESARAAERLAVPPTAAALQSTWPGLRLAGQSTRPAVLQAGPPAQRPLHHVHQTPSPVHRSCTHTSVLCNVTAHTWLDIHRQWPGYACWSVSSVCLCSTSPGTAGKVSPGLHRSGLAASLQPASGSKASVPNTSAYIRCSAESMPHKYVEIVEQCRARRMCHCQFCL